MNERDVSESFCSPCILRGDQTKICRFKGDKYRTDQRKQFHTKAPVPEEISKDKNLATADRMKCPIKLFKCLMKTNVWEGISFLRLHIWSDSPESRKPGGEKEPLPRIKLSQAIPPAWQQPQLSFEGEFSLAKEVFLWKKAIQWLSRQSKGEGLKQALLTQQQRGAPVLLENSPCSSALLL